MSKVYKCALYTRLSKEDGDKADSDSIITQLNMLNSFCAAHDDLQATLQFSDDGYTGTNFDRPAFGNMMAAVNEGLVNCIIVKDLSRFGRDYIDMGRYLERVFPEKGIRFIAINDNIDSIRGPYDMMLPVKNIFNTQYARDISEKIKSALNTKRRQGHFIGAFPSYGYCKDPENKNRLLIDECAAKVVRRIFDLFEQGMGKDRIARTLNADCIPCPSEYKRIMGDNYQNGLKLSGTTYWTYSTVERILSKRIYAGDMVQGKYTRAVMHGKAHKAPEEEWSVVECTHEPIISKPQWERVQKLLAARARSVNFNTDKNPLGGFIKCGDCGRSMVHRGTGSSAYYNCGTYDRYGPKVCAKHRVSQRAIENAILDDLNRIISAAGEIHRISVPKGSTVSSRITEHDRLTKAIERISALRKGVYEDYKDKLLSKDDYLAYKSDYEAKERKLRAQLDRLQSGGVQSGFSDASWISKLSQCGKLTSLDRTTVAETVESINVYSDGHVEINYRFSPDLARLLEGDHHTNEKV